MKEKGGMFVEIVWKIIELVTKNRDGRLVKVWFEGEGMMMKMRKSSTLGGIRACYLLKPIISLTWKVSWPWWVEKLDEKVRERERVKERERVRERERDAQTSLLSSSPSSSS